jgi:Spy/CpxP family protein refolding chaperone
MNRTAPIIAAIVVVLWCAAASPAPPDEPDRSKAGERVEILRMWKMMEALDLDKATADKIFEIRRKFVAEKKRLEQDVAEDFRRMRQLLREAPDKTDERELERLLKSIGEKRKKIEALWNQQYDDVSKVLSIRQQAELMLFLKDFNRQLRSLMQPPGTHGHGQPPHMGKGRRGMGPPMPPGGPPGPPPPGRPDESDDPVEKD